MNKEKKNNSKKYISIGVVLFLFPILLVVIGLWPRHNFYTLPYYGLDTIYQPEIHEDFTSEEFFTLPDFEFTNQYKQAFGTDSLLGEVYLAVFYSTNSPVITDITKQLLSINYKYRDVEGVRIVCFSLDTEHDNPEVLKEYVDDLTTYNKYPGKWQFLTGDQKKITQLIQDGFLIDDPDNTSVVWLVDKDGHLRGRYHLNVKSEIKLTMEDIALLKKEMDLELKALEEE